MRNSPGLKSHNSLQIIKKLNGPRAQAIKEGRLTGRASRRRGPEILPIAAVIGFMAKERHTRSLRCVPSSFACAAQQFSVRFDAKSDQIRKCPHRIGVSAGSVTVVHY
jgi:hypothetical protein